MQSNSDGHSPPLPGVGFEATTLDNGLEIQLSGCRVRAEGDSFEDKGRDHRLQGDRATWGPSVGHRCQSCHADSLGPVGTPFRTSIPEVVREASHQDTVSPSSSHFMGISYMSMCPKVQSLHQSRAVMHLRLQHQERTYNLSTLTYLMLRQIMQRRGSCAPCATDSVCSAFLVSHNTNAPFGWAAHTTLPPL